MLNSKYDKKVLLCECKSHTSHSEASTRCAALFPGGGGGQVPPSSLTGGTPIQPEGVSPPHLEMGVAPLPPPPLGWIGYPPVGLDWVPPPDEGWMGNPPPSEGWLGTPYETGWGYPPGKGRMGVHLTHTILQEG